ncbi:sugar phosphate isomerase/epimerase [Candidatus Woesearchaeota archaeon]|nr:sugar phosphate isomerase/epimerase [Candidatus Woesearchaeota archaeon]
MFIGTNLSAWKPGINRNLLFAIQEAYKLGFDCFELLPSVQSFKYYNVLAIKLKKFKFRYAVHSVWIDQNLASINSFSRKAAVQQVKKEIVFAKLLSAEIIVAHPGKIFKNQKNLADKNLNQSIKEILPFAKKHKVFFTLENMLKEDHPFKTFEDVRQILEQNPALKMTFDFAHCAIAKQDINKFLSGFKDRIVHYHATGAYVSQKEDTHVLSLKTSKIPLNRYFKKIKNQKKMIIIEQNRIKQILESKQILNKILK